MSIVKNVVLPCLYGMAIAAVGFSALTWQYWLLLALAFAWRFWPERKEVLR